MGVCLIAGLRTHACRWAGMDCALPPGEHSTALKLSSGKAREPACSAELLLPGALER